MRQNGKGMEENNKIPEESVADGGTGAKMSFGKWIENVWYHYKWHIIGVAFMLLVVIVCITQCVGKARDPIDINIVYAGSYQIPKTADKDGKIPFKDMSDTIKNLISDYDENGKKVLNFQSYYWLSTDELDALAEKNAELDPADRVDVEYHASVVYQAITDINSLMAHSDYYVWFISDDLYEYMKRTSGGANRYVSLDEHVNDGTKVTYYTDGDGNTDTCAVYLKDLPIYSMGTLSTLPEDTLVVLRTPSVLDRNNLTGYERSCAFIEKILNQG